MFWFQVNNTETQLIRGLGLIFLKEGPSSIILSMGIVP